MGTPAWLVTLAVTTSIAGILTKASDIISPSTQKGDSAMTLRATDITLVGGSVTVNAQPRSDAR